MLQRLQRRLEGLEDFGVADRVIHGIYPDAKTADSVRQRFRVVRHWLAGGRRVSGIMTGEHLECDCAIFDRSCERAGMIEAVKARMDTLLADAAVRRLESDDTAQGRWNSH